MVGGVRKIEEEQERVRTLARRAPLPNTCLLTLSHSHTCMHAERGKEMMTVVSPDSLRLGHVWVPADLRWYRRRVTLNLLRQVGVTGGAAHKAVDVSGSLGGRVKGEWISGRAGQGRADGRGVVFQQLVWRAAWIGSQQQCGGCL